jgi:hypothetical protein
MQVGLLWAGRLLGITGVALTAVAVATRLGGSYYVGGFEAVTILNAGVASMVGGCLAYLTVIAERGR